MTRSPVLPPRALVVATTNAGKLAEYRELLAGLPFEVLSLRDFPALPQVVEDGATFRANALKKAEGYAAALGRAVLADDSGLEVGALGGAPGVESARYAGVQQDSEANIDKLLAAMADVAEERRTARFVCAVAVVGWREQPILLEATCEGRILRERSGAGGFGYDPVFLFPALDRSFAQLSSREKNEVSHRGKVGHQLRQALKP